MNKFILEIRNSKELDLMFEKFEDCCGIQESSLNDDVKKCPIYFRIENGKIEGWNCSNVDFYKKDFPEYPIITFDVLNNSSVNISNEDELLLLL